MGREIRRVPPNWQHPEKDDRHRGGTRPQPMHNQHFSEAFDDWLQEFDRVRAGNLKDFERTVYTSDWPLAEWLQDDGGPPNPDYYRPWRDEEATWFQVWETVSEGTPVTPPFATREELVDYLVANGDFWDQKRCEEGNRFMQPKKPGYSRETATKFVMGTGWAPSMIVVHKPGQPGQVFEGIESVNAATLKD